MAFNKPLTIRLALLAILAFAAANFVGCKESDGRVNVSGKVTWNGKPLDTGTVIFQPTFAGSPEASQLSGGNYSLRVQPGEYTVSISSQKEQGWDSGMNQPRFVQVVPEKFNVETELTATVTAEGENNFPFELEGKEP